MVNQLLACWSWWKHQRGLRSVLRSL